MPATYAHLMITEKALERFVGDEAIDGKLRGFALTHSHFVLLGSVGPDYPYLDFFQPKQKDWADHMHYRHTGDVIKSMAQKLVQLWRAGSRGEEFAVPFCWTLGYLSHVTGDLVVHPVVMNIVGEYKGHEKEHRRCEMIHDSFIYNKVRRGAEIEHNQLMKIVQLCSAPGNKDIINPVLCDFWKEVLHVHFPADYQDNQPDIDQWHDQFEDWIGVAGKPLFVGRILDPKHRYTYKKSSDITSQERRTFLNLLPLPGNRIGNYETDLFPKAMSHVVDHWVLLTKGIAGGDISLFLSTVTNGDLDTGRELGTERLIYW